MGQGIAVGGCIDALTDDALQGGGGDGDKHKPSAIYQFIRATPGVFDSAVRVTANYKSDI